MQQDNSHSILGKTTKKTKQNKFGWIETSAIPADEPCVIALGGSGTNDSKKAHGFVNMIKEILKDKKIPVYAAKYDMADRNFRVDREAVLARYKQEDARFPFIRQVKEKDKTYIPQYIHELYQSTIAPRLRDEQGNRVSLHLAARRLNMMVFANHCHGSTVLIQMEHLMAEDMKNLGFSEAKQNYLFKQIHAVDVAPVSPIGITKMTTIKFASFADEKVTSVHTPKIQHILKRKEEHERYLANIGKKEQQTTDNPLVMNFSVFRPTENETIFAVNNMYPLEIQKDKDYEGIEHTFASYSDKDDDNRTKQGDQLSFCFHTTLNALAKHAMQNQNELQELPDIMKISELSAYVKRAQNNRYDFITREIKLIKAHKNTKEPR